MSIQRILATAANEDDLLIFNVAVSPYANPTERRGMTVLYAVPLEYFVECQHAAIKCGITLQLRVEAKPYWKLISQGKAPQWTPPVETK